MKLTILIAAALGLAACAPAQAPAPNSPTTPEIPAVQPQTGPSGGNVSSETLARADAALARAWSAWSAISRTADLVVPFLSPTRAANVRSIQATVRTAFERARRATTLADRALELAEAVKAAGRLEALVVDPD